MSLVFGGHVDKALGNKCGAVIVKYKEGEPVW